MHSKVAAVAAGIVLVCMAVWGVACSDDDDTPPEVTTPVDASPSPGPSPASSPAAAVTYAEPGPETFAVRAGKSDGAIDVEMFMPSDVHIREGDSIEWTSLGYEGHTVTFGTDEQVREIMSQYLQPDPNDPEQRVFNPMFALPQGPKVIDGSGTYVNSGFFGVPAEATFTLTFEESGIYRYLCVVHPLWMRGTVSVDGPDAQVESAETVAARGEEELARYMGEAEHAMAQAAELRRTAPAPDGASVHHIATGLTTPYGQVAVYEPAALTIKAGDTVIFENDDRNFHNVIFKGSLAEPPPGYEVYVDPETGGINVALAKESSLAVEPPPSGFDDQTFLSSGSMGPSMPRSRWQLTFDTPGRYLYNCTIHVFAGMSGVIEVVPR